MSAFRNKPTDEPSTTEVAATEELRRTIKSVMPVGAGPRTGVAQGTKVQGSGKLKGAATRVPSGVRIANKN